MKHEPAGSRDGGKKKTGPDRSTIDQKLHGVPLTKLLAETKLGCRAHRKTKSS